MPTDEISTYLPIIFFDNPIVTMGLGGFEPRMSPLETPGGASYSPSYLTQTYIH